MRSTISVRCSGWRIKHEAQRARWTEGSAAFQLIERQQKLIAHTTLGSVLHAWNGEVGNWGARSVGGYGGALGCEKGSRPALLSALDSNTARGLRDAHETH